jgi:hypothetical protein
MAMQQELIDWSYQSHIFLADFLGLCKGDIPIYPQNMARHMGQYLHFRILEFPLKQYGMFIYPTTGPNKVHDSIRGAYEFV